MVVVDPVAELVAYMPEPVVGRHVDNDHGWLNRLRRCSLEYYPQRRRIVIIRRHYDGHVGQHRNFLSVSGCIIGSPDVSLTVGALVHEFTCLWYRPFHARPLKVVLIRNPDSDKDFDIAIASTNTTATATQIIERYDGRWVIETVHQEAKAHGVGDARNRVPGAVRRTVPFGFLTITITIAWYQLCGDPEADLTERRRQAPWYRQKTTVSYADMLAALRRELIRGEFHTQGHSITTNTKNTEPQLLPALTAA